MTCALRKEHVNNGLIEALREREKALRAQIAQATADQRKREAKNRKRLAEIIGGALIDADIPPDLKSSIKEILAGPVLRIGGNDCFTKEAGCDRADLGCGGRGRALLLAGLSVCCGCVGLLVGCGLGRGFRPRGPGLDLDDLTRLMDKGFALLGQ